MPLLEVRDFPADVYEKIVFEARLQERTIAQETIVLIKKGLGEEISNKERRRQAIERSNNRNIPSTAQSVDYVKLIREDRDR